MNQVQLNDRLYKEAQRRASEAGFSSVDDYVAEVVAQDLSDDNFDHLFTPERLAELNRISSDIKAGGKTYSMDEVEQHFKDKRKAWQAKNPG